MPFIRPALLLLPAFAAILLALVCGCAQSPEKRAAHFLELGKQHFEKKKYENAVLEFQNALQQMPGHPEVHYRLGLAYLAQNKLGVAVSHLLTAANADPKNTKAQMELAGILVGSDEQGILNDAESRIAKVVAAEPGNIDALRIQALAWARLGKEEQAIGQLARILEKVPGDLKTSLTAASIHIERKRFSEAGVFLRQAIAHNSKSAEPVVALGRLHLLAGSTREAEESFERALQIDPDNASALFELARLHAVAGRTERAERTLKKLSSLPDPGLKSLHAMFLYQMGRKEAAIQELEQLSRQDPSNKDVRNRLVELYLATGRSADAEKLLGLILKKELDADALEQLARIHLDNGRLEQAENNLMQALRVRSRSATGHYLMARLRRLQGHVLMHRQELQEALRWDPSLLPARIELSEQLRSGRGARTALDLLDKMPESQKSHLPAIIERNWVLIALGDFAAARKGVDQGLAKGQDPALALQDALLDLQIQKLALARTKLEKVLSGEPENLLALESLAQSFELEKKPLMASERVRAHAASHADLAHVQHFLGEWLEKTGDRKGARAAYAQALKADQGFVRAGIATVRLDLLDKNWPEARQRLQRILQSSPRNTDALLAQGMLDDETGNHAAAISAYRKLLAVDSNHPYALNNLAYRLVEQADRLDEALQLAQRAKELLPEDPAVDNTIGWAYYKKGLYPNALIHLQRAVARAPTPRRRYHLAMACFQVGDRKAGERILEEAIKMDPNLPEAVLAKELAGSKR